METFNQITQNDGTGLLLTIIAWGFAGLIFLTGTTGIIESFIEKGLGKVTSIIVVTFGALTGLLVAINHDIFNNTNNQEEYTVATMTIDGTKYENVLTMNLDDSDETPYIALRNGDRMQVPKGTKITNEKEVNRDQLNGKYKEKVTEP